MPKKKYLVTLTDEERTQLEQLLRGGKTATRKVTRARILLKAADGWADQRIAEALHIGRSRHWMNVRAPATSRSWMRRPKPD